MRTLTDHKLNGLNDALDITVLDEPGSGGAHHQYQISWGQVERGPKPTIAELEAILEKGDKSVSLLPDGGVCVGNTALICFQNGPIQEAGVNGISGEALLAIVIDRLRCFQSGPYASADNASALIHAEACLADLQKAHP
jgi:hypothetical protein